MSALAFKFVPLWCHLVEVARTGELSATGTPLVSLEGRGCTCDGAMTTSSSCGAILRSGFIRLLPLASFELKLGVSAVRRRSVPLHITETSASGIVYLFVVGVRVLWRNTWPRGYR